MPFPSSIPPELHSEVVRRWLNGDAAQTIADWVMQSSARRGRSSPTSRTSVTRLVRKLSQRSADRASATIRRARIDAPAAMEAIAANDDAYRALAIESADAATPEVLRRIRADLAECARKEKLLHRLLEVAGVGSEAAHALATATPVDSIMLDLQLIDDSKRAECESDSESECSVSVTNDGRVIDDAAAETRSTSPFRSPLICSPWSIRSVQPQPHSRVGQPLFR